MPFLIPAVVPLVPANQANQSSLHNAYRYRLFDKSTGGMAREARAKMAREGISLGALLWVTLRSVAAGVYDALRGVVGWSPSTCRSSVSQATWPPSPTPTAADTAPCLRRRVCE